MRKGVAEIVLGIVFACVATIGRCELFTSMAHLQTALDAERDIATVLKSYVKEEERRLQEIKRLAEDMESHSAKALENPTYYLANPVNAFLFVKRFTLDWARSVDNLLKNDSSDIMRRYVEYYRQDLPKYEDLQGAASALMRLQDTYKLDTARIASGDLGGVKSTTLTASDCFEIGKLSYNSEDYPHTSQWMEEVLQQLDSQNDAGNDTVPRVEVLDYLAFAEYREVPDPEKVIPLFSHLMTAAECFELGRFAYIAGDYYHTVLWMHQALQVEEDEQNKTIQRSEVLDYLGYALAMKGNIRTALTFTEELLTLEPDHERAANNKRYYEKMLSEREEEQSVGTRGDEEMVLTRNDEAELEYRRSEEFQNYEALCRNEKIMEVANLHKLKCRYLTRNHPMLIISPALEEDVSLDPWMVKYHSVISDSEIEAVKEIATPRLNRATVQNAKTGQLETAAYRISKSAWLKGDEYAVVSRLNKRIEAITGLNLETAEELQVANYGLGGHYEPHFDFARNRKLSEFEKRVGNRIATFLVYKEEKDAFKSLGTGNRIATFLFYMSDVEAGGATVFPYIGVKVFPMKGTAAFWYNLYKNGQGIYNTRHAACPVLVGTKWVSNKWIHERGQEFRRPCSLSELE